MKISLSRVGITAAMALGLALTTGVSAANAAAKPNTVDYFFSGGKKRAMVVFSPRDSAKDDERVLVDDLSKDNHYVWTEIYDVTAKKLKGHCQTPFKSCAYDIPEGHQVRINVYRMNKSDVDFMGEVQTKSGKLPTA